MRTPPPSSLRMKITKVLRKSKTISWLILRSIFRNNAETVFPNRCRGKPLKFWNSKSFLIPHFKSILAINGSQSIRNYFDEKKYPTFTVLVGGGECGGCFASIFSEIPDRNLRASYIFLDIAKSVLENTYSICNPITNTTKMKISPKKTTRPEGKKSSINKVENTSFFHPGSEKTVCSVSL